MKQAEIKLVKEQLKVGKVPVATIHYVHEGEPTQVFNSTTAVDMLRANWAKDTIELHESFYIILMNRANRVKGIALHSQGGLSGTVIDQRLILALALLSLSTSIIIAHNHPSGNVKPSDADIKITKKIKEACELVEINVLDHVILTKDSYMSFADEGIFELQSNNPSNKTV